ncbi:MAG TPA: chemotaxis protein CheX [Polyangia bacterium]|nr:chemotaxis protein CheX [Polyangia bacterium]
MTIATTKTMLVAEQARDVRTYLMEACLETFVALGFPAVPAPVEEAAAATHDVAGFIGLSGGVRGSLMISSATELFRGSYPSTIGGAPEPPDLLDWAGEMANQLLGRVKRRFCERGADFQISTPTAVRGRFLVGRSPAREGVCDLAFVVGGNVVAVSFEVCPDPSGKVFADAAQPIGCAPEGEMVLF